jgi:tRNA nucleotidyltransferase/poly(A) polymerase
MNSIYFDIETETFIDPNGGIADIQNGVIRFV